MPCHDICLQDDFWASRTATGEFLEGDRITQGATVGDRQAETEVDNPGPYNGQKMAADQSHFEAYCGFNVSRRLGHVSQPQSATFFPNPFFCWRGLGRPKPPSPLLHRMRTGVEVHPDS